MRTLRNVLLVRLLLYSDQSQTTASKAYVGVSGSTGSGTFYCPLQHCHVVGMYVGVCVCGGGVCVCSMVGNVLMRRH